MGNKLANTSGFDPKNEFEKAKALLTIPSRENIENAYSRIKELADAHEYVPAMKWLADYSESVLGDYKQAMMWYKKMAEVSERVPSRPQEKPAEQVNAVSSEAEPVVIPQEEAARPDPYPAERKSPGFEEAPQHDESSRKKAPKWAPILFAVLALIAVAAAVFFGLIYPKMGKEAEIAYSPSLTEGKKVYCNITSVYPKYGKNYADSNDVEYICCLCEYSDGPVWIYLPTELYSDKLDANNDVLHFGHSGVKTSKVSFSPAISVHGVIKEADSLCKGLGSCAAQLVLFVESVDETAEPSMIPSSEPSPISTSAPVSSWEIDNYVDDFGDKTGATYLRGEFKGRFSNSATTGSSLTVYFYYDANICSIRLLEYDSHKANISTSDEVFFKFKIENKEYSIRLNTLGYGSDLYFMNYVSEFDTLKDALLCGKEIKCVVMGTRYGDTYIFIMNGIGFKQALKDAGLN